MTQADRVYDVLSDGAWHDTREIESITKVTRVTSRVWDLKQKGHLIEARPGEYKFSQYRLTPSGESQTFQELKLLKQVEDRGMKIPAGLQQKLL